MKNQESGNVALSDFNLWVNPGLFSYHFDRNAGFRGLNWGLGIQSDLSGDMSVVAGTFINSDYARSNYAGMVWQPLSWQSAKIGLVAGILNGYPLMRNGGVFPAILPWVTFRNEHAGVNLTLIPNYSNRLHGAIVAQFILRVW